MALTANQTTQMTALKDQVADLKEALMNSPQCTMAGMGNYIFEAFKGIDAQIKKVEEA